MTRALITGASAGLGLTFARRLASDGYDLVLVSRDPERLGRVAQEIGGMFDIDAEVLPADLSTDAGIETVRARIEDEAKPVDVLVNNAGAGLRGSYLQSEPEEIRALETLLYTAVSALSHAAARTFAPRGRGGIITVSSLAGLFTAGPYSATKAAATSITECLAGELAGTGVTVTAVLPGFVRTEFHHRAGMSLQGMRSSSILDAGHVVDRALRDARAGRVISIAGAGYRFGAPFLRAAPRAIVRSASRGFQADR